MSDSSAKIDGFKQKAEKVRGFHNLIGDTIRLREEMAKTADKSGDAFGRILKSHDANIAKLKSHGIAVGALDKDYARLGRTLEGLELGAAGRHKIGEGVQQIRDSWKAGAAITASIAAPTMVSANYQAIIRDIAIKGDIARTGKEDAMSESIRRDAADSGIDRNELAEAVNNLVAGSMDVAEAAAQAKNVARFSVSQNADSTDTAKLVLALRQAGITDPAAIERMLGKIAVAGDLGSFEAKDMAKHFASLMPQLTAFGMAGEKATVELANMLQTQMKAAGSADEAAVNLANLLSKITSDDTKKKFSDSGIKFQESMLANIAQGYDPITSFLGLVQEAANRTDPSKAREMAALQAQITKTQDPAAAQKMLNGYLEMAGLSEYISDRQAKQAALAALQNQKLHRENLKTIQTTDGVAKIEKDLADRRAASQQKWREVGQAMDETLARIGDAVRPLTDLAATGMKSLAGAVSGLAKEFPNVTSGVLTLGAAFAAVKIGSAAAKIGGGLIDVARGGWLARGSGKLLGGLGGAVLDEKGGFARVGRTRSKGKAGKVADVLGAVTGAGGTPVFVTNWPGSGLGLPDGKGRTGKAGPAAGKPGATSRLGAAVTGTLGAGRAALAAPTLGAVAAGGTGTMLAAGGMVAAAGAAGYGIGSVINAGINKAVSAATGSDNTLGGWLYDKLHPEQPAPAPTSARPVPQTITFSPQIQVDVQGDVKDPRQIAADLMPHLKRMFEQFQAQAARGALYDGETP